MRLIFLLNCLLSTFPIGINRFFLVFELQYARVIHNREALIDARLINKIT